MQLTKHLFCILSVVLLAGCVSTTDSNAVTGAAADCTMSALKTMGYEVKEHRRVAIVADRAVNQSFWKGVMAGLGNVDVVDRLTALYAGDSGAALLKVDPATVSLANGNGPQLGGANAPLKGTLIKELDPTDQVKTDAQVLLAKCAK